MAAKESVGDHDDGPGVYSKDRTEAAGRRWPTRAGRCPSERRSALLLEKRSAQSSAAQSISGGVHRADTGREDTGHYWSGCGGLKSLRWLNSFILNTPWICDGVRVSDSSRLGLARQTGVDLIRRPYIVEETA